MTDDVFEALGDAIQREKDSQRMIDPERAQWLRALRRRLLLPGRQPIPETRRWVVVIGDPTE